MNPMMHGVELKAIFSRNAEERWQDSFKLNFKAISSQDKSHLIDDISTAVIDGSVLELNFQSSVNGCNCLKYFQWIFLRGEFPQILGWSFLKSFIQTLNFNLKSAL